MKNAAASSMNQKSASSQPLSSYQKSRNTGSSPSLSQPAGTNGTTTGTSNASRKFTCSDCQRTVSTYRNLQRHRTVCKSALASKAAAGQLQATVISMPLSNSQVGIIKHIRTLFFHFIKCSVFFSHWKGNLLWCSWLCVVVPIINHYSRLLTLLFWELFCFDF